MVREQTHDSKESSAKMWLPCMGDTHWAAFLLSLACRLHAQVAGTLQGVHMEAARPLYPLCC